MFYRVTDLHMPNHQMPMIQVAYHYQNGGTRTGSKPLYVFGSQALHDLQLQARGVNGGGPASFAWHGRQYAVFHRAINGGEDFYTVNTIVGGSCTVDMKDAKRDEFGVLHVNVA